MRAVRSFLCLIAALFIANVALAVEPDEVLADPGLESRARALSQELRCVVCQNESIDASSADIARDLRILVRERLMAGDSDDEVMAFVTARYGDYVLLRPRLSPSTYLLWFGPFIILGIGGIAIFLFLRRRKGNQDDTDAMENALTPAEEKTITTIRGERL